MKLFGRNRFTVVLSLCLLASFISSTSGQANTKLVKSGYEFVLPPGGQVKFNVRVEKDKWNQFQFRSKSIASWESNFNFVMSGACQTDLGKGNERFRPYWPLEFSVGKPITTLNVFPNKSGTIEIFCNNINNYGSGNNFPQRTLSVKLNIVTQPYSVGSEVKSGELITLKSQQVANFWFDPRTEKQYDFRQWSDGQDKLGHAPFYYKLQLDSKSFIQPSRLYLWDDYWSHPKNTGDNLVGGEFFAGRTLKEQGLNNTDGYKAIGDAPYCYNVLTRGEAWPFYYRGDRELPNGGPSLGTYITDSSNYGGFITCHNRTTKTVKFALSLVNVGTENPKKLKQSDGKFNLKRGEAKLFIFKAPESLSLSVQADNIKPEPPLGKKAVGSCEVRYETGAGYDPETNYERYFDDYLLREDIMAGKKLVLDLRRGKDPYLDKNDFPGFQGQPYLILSCVSSFEYSSTITVSGVTNLYEPVQEASLRRLKG